MTTKEALRKEPRKHKLQSSKNLDGPQTTASKQNKSPKPGKKPRKKGAIAVFDWSGKERIVRRYRPKMGRVFRKFFALDCETTVTKDHSIPDLAIVAVSDGVSHYLIHPDDLPAFIFAHPKPSIVCHNVAFDFWVIHQHLSDADEQDALKAWIDVAKKGLHDTMLLDILLCLANGTVTSGLSAPRNLGVIAREYTDLEIDKEDPHRLRYGELIGANWSKADVGFFEYPAKDAMVTIKAYREMHRQAHQVLKEAGFDGDTSDHFDIRPDAVIKFGLLTEAIQVGAAIALEAISRAGMHTNQKRLAKTKSKYSRRVTTLIASIIKKYPGFFKLKAGELLQTKTGAPSRSNKELDKYLLKAAEEIAAKSGNPIVVPRTEKGQISKSLKAWESFLTAHPFLRLWSRYENATKLSQFIKKLGSSIIRPRYSVLVGTGRTGCSNPNMQQVPREDDFREVIVPRKGRLLLATDYKFIELVTLAATCLGRFGYSRLGEVIAEGIDPHCYTAAMLRDMPYEEFMALKKSKPERFKQDRQMAKPINFGVPGGMGADSLIDYSQKSYGVKMNKEEAEVFRQRLIEDIYPELKLYMDDKSMEILAENLETSPEELWARLDRDGDRSGRIPGSIRKIVDGNPNRADGIPYNEGYVERVWEVLNEINRNPQFVHSLQNRVGSPELSGRLFHCSVATLTGRVRGGVTYTSARNTPFQGLAADGAKLALKNLTLDGYCVVGFIHDEILIELPDEGGYVRRDVVEKIERIMKESMEQVTEGIPVECESTLSTCWSKRAEYIEENGRVYAWKPPRQSGKSKK